MSYGELGDQRIDDPTDARSSERSSERPFKRPTLAEIAEHLELADKLRADGNAADADALVEAASQLAEDLAESLSDVERRTLLSSGSEPRAFGGGGGSMASLSSGQIPTLPQGQSYQSPWLRAFSSGSPSPSTAPAFAASLPASPSPMAPSLAAPSLAAPSLAAPLVTPASAPSKEPESTESILAQRFPFLPR